MAGLTEYQAREQFSKMGIGELNQYATDNSMPISEDKAQQIDILLGKCHGCGNNNITVVYKKATKSTTLAVGDVPCGNCNK